MSKLRKYRLHWEATIHGYQVVEAFSEEDAQDQFNSRVHLDEDKAVYAELENVEEVVTKKKGKK